MSHEADKAEAERLHRTRAELGYAMAAHLSGLDPDDIDHAELDAIRARIWSAEKAALDADPTETYYPNDVYAFPIYRHDETYIDDDEYGPDRLSLSRVENDTSLTRAERFNEARAWLVSHEADRDVRAYASATGPLMLDEIDAARVSSEAFERVKDKYGWPGSVDADIAPALHYDDDDFLVQYFEQPSKTAILTNSQDAERNERALNNFMQFLRARPVTDVSEMSGGLEGMYGLAPVVHRANALAPEFFQALRVAANAFDISDGDAGRAILGQERNIAVLRALNMGYRIMGRLLKASDFSSEEVSAHEELTR